MVPDLAAEDVTVFDQSTGQSFREEPEGSAFDTRLLARRHEFSTLYRDRIAAALSYIPNVLVTVDVDLDNLKSSVVREQLVDPKKTVALAQSETTRSSTATQRPAVAEPGQVPNRPRELQSGPGQDRSHVTSDSATSSVSAASFTVSEKQFLAALPTSIQVAVQIPEDYYAALEQRRAPAAGAGTTPGTDGTGAAAAAVPTKKREEVERDVKAAVARAIGAGSKVDDISVTSYVRVDPVVPPLDVPILETVQEGVRQWGGPVVLVLLTVWVLRYATRSLPALPEVPAADSPAVAVLRKGKAAAEEPPQPPGPPELSPRDRLQVVVRDNPEMTADLIAKWVQAAK
jgi:flagellar M-ring protein FliF